MATTLPSDIPFGKYLLGSPWARTDPEAISGFLGPPWVALDGPECPHARCELSSWRHDALFPGAATPARAPWKFAGQRH